MCLVPENIGLELLVLVRILAHATAVQGIDRGHLRIRELKEEHIEVLALALGMLRLGDGHDVVLDVPAQHDAADRDAEPAGDLPEHGLAQEVAAATERAPALGDDALGGVEGALPGLREGSTGTSRSS